jgi:hypothetical protein
MGKASKTTAAIASASKPKVDPRGVTHGLVSRAPHEATGEVVELFGSEPARKLYAAFGNYNRQFFGGELGAPLVLISPAGSARSLGDYCTRDVHGLESRIRIAPKAVRRGERFALDVLLHEMVHAWQAEIDEDEENSYRGHGPKFAEMCTRIGKKLGLHAVGVKGRDGLPDCAHWPMCVRPPGYYPELYIAPTRKPKDPPAPAEPGGGEDGEGVESPRDPLAAIKRLLPELEPDELHELLAEVTNMIEGD